MGIHLIPNDGCAGNNKVTAFIVVEVLVVHVVLQSAVCIVRWYTKGNATNVAHSGVVAPYVDR